MWEEVRERIREWERKRPALSFAVGQRRIVLRDGQCQGSLKRMNRKPNIKFLKELTDVGRNWSEIRSKEKTK